MTRLIYFLVAVCFFCFSAFSNAQESTSYIQQCVNGVCVSQYDHNGDTYYSIPENPNDLEEDKNYFSPTIISNDPADWKATTGCLEASAENNGDGIWAQTTGGQCANIGTNGQGAIRFGYVNTVVSNTWEVLAGVFEEIGLNVFGYRYSWYVKNYNAMDTSPNQTGAQDPLKVRVIVKDSSGNDLFSKEYDYSESISYWKPESGFEFFDATTDIGSVTLEVEGYDAGYWAGWWGPEFREAELNMLFYYKDPDDKCDTDPLSSPTCPGYADALYKEQEEMLKLIESSKQEELFTDDVAFVEDVNKVVEESIAPVEEVKVEESFEEEKIDDGIPKEEIAEVKPENVEELVEKQFEESIEAAVEDDTITAEVESEVIQETTTSNINALSVAQGAVSSALSEANQNINNTLNQTSQSVSQAEQLNQQLEQQAQISNATSFTGDASDSNTSIASTGNASQDMSSTSSTSNMQTTAIDNVASIDTTLQSIDSTTFNNTSVQSTSVDTSSSQTTASQSLNTEMQADATSQTGIDNFGNVNTDSINTSSTSTNQNSFDSGVDEIADNSNISSSVVTIEVTVDSFEIAALNLAIDEVFQAALTRNEILTDSEQSEEEEQKSFEEQNAEEDSLVSAAQSGDDSEDAQAALLGYNPNFRAYQQPQIPDNQFYQPKDIYADQKNYDNPNGRFFNGASDTLHREMVRQQYEGN